MAVDSENDAETNGCFGCGDTDGEDGKHDPGEGCWIRTIAPEGDEVEVGCIQHQLDADQDENGIAPSQCAAQPNREDESGQEEITGQRAHPCSFVSGMATMTAPISAAVRRRPMISRGRAKVCISASPI